MKFAEKLKKAMQEQILRKKKIYIQKSVIHAMI